MTTRQIENRIKKLNELELQKKAIEEQAEKLKAELKEDMEAKGAEELQAGNFIVRWKTIISNRFDSKAFSKEHEAMYGQYVRQTATKRFTIA